MATNKIRLGNYSGKQVPFIASKIKETLIGRNAGVPEMWGEAWVWACDPIMVGIWKSRDTKRGPFTYEVIESDENCLGNIVDIVHLEFKEEELDEAITIFMALCKKPKKNFQRNLIERMGGHAIFIKELAIQSHTK